MKPFWEASHATQVCDTCNEPRRLPRFAIGPHGVRLTTCTTCRRAAERAELRAKNAAARASLTPDDYTRTALAKKHEAVGWYSEAARRRKAS